MTGSVYQYLTGFEEVGGDMTDRIQKAALYNIFKPLLEDEQFADQHDKLNTVLFWILHAYSLESTMDIVAADWKTRKLTIAKKTGMPEHFTDLTDYSIRTTIINYLDFQNYRTYKHLMILREQYEEMLSASLSPLKKSSAEGQTAEIDYKAKFECGVYGDRLLERIQMYEQKLKDDNASLKSGIEEVEKKQDRRMGQAMSIDTSEFIKT